VVEESISQKKKRGKKMEKEGRIDIYKDDKKNGRVGDFTKL
jgi:hypothetical protein